MIDIFQLLGQQQKTGVLNLQDGKKEVQVLFDKGMIVGTALPPETADESPLAKRLIRGGLLSQENWKKAYNRCKEELTSMEQVLLSNGMVIKEDLVAVKKLLTLETIYGLFKWKGGTFRFETKDVTYDPEFVEPMAAEYLLLDVLRMVDEWPMLAKRIPNFEIVLQKVNSLNTLDVLTGTPWEKNRTFQMEVLYGLINGQRTIQEIMDLTFLGEFDTCKNLILLMDAGVIKPTSVNTSIEKLKNPQVYRYFRDAGAYLLLGFLAFFLIFQVAVNRWADFPFSQEERELWISLRDPLRKIELVRTMNAREVFFLEENRYPNNPAEMLNKGLLTR